MTSAQLLPGVMQDGKGRLYRYARYPSGKTIVVPYTEPERQPLTFRLAHIWRVGPKLNEVDPCGNPRCTVCNNTRSKLHYTIRGQS